MEQSDLAQFRYYESDTDSGQPGFLDCNYCPQGRNSVKYYGVMDAVPSLLELMEDAAAHFAAVHRKSNEAV